MFDSDDVSAFNADVVAASNAAFPQAFSFRGENVTLKCTSIKTAEKLQDGGFAGIYDATARLSVAILATLPEAKRTAPEEGEKLTHSVSGCILRIKKIDLPGEMPEYVLHLMKAHG